MIQSKGYSDRRSWDRSGSKKFEKKRKKFLTNGLRCANINKLLARAAVVTESFAKWLWKKLKNFEKST